MIDYNGCIFCVYCCMYWYLSFACLFISCEIFFSFLCMQLFCFQSIQDVSVYIWYKDVAAASKGCLKTLEWYNI